MAAEQGIDRESRHVLDAIADGVHVTGPGRTIVLRSAGAEGVTGCGAREIVGSRCDEQPLAHTAPDETRTVHGSRSAPAEVAGPRVTASAGGALVAADGQDQRAALTRADAAMPAAKHGGRGGFSVSGDGREW